MISSFHTVQQGRAALVPSVRTPGAPLAKGLSGIVTLSQLNVPKGETLYMEGSEPTAPYLVVSGVLRVLVRAPNGRDRLVDLAGAGDVLATAVFDLGPHAETVVAASDAVVAIIDLDRTLGRVQGRQDLASALVRQLNRSREMADDLGLPMGARICRILARVAERLGDKVKPGRRPAADPGAEWRHLPFSLTHDDVALLAGCARVTATRVLGELKEAQVLDGHRGNYSVVPAALEVAADEYVYEVL